MYITYSQGNDNQILTKIEVSTVLMQKKTHKIIAFSPNFSKTV